MMGEVCKVMAKKDMYPVCHDYRYISGDDSEGGAKAHDPTAKHLEYCDVCNRSVTCEQRLNLSCHTYCIFCGGDVPHNDCAEFESRDTRSISAKSELCMICCKYVSREELETGSCHARVTSVNTHAYHWEIQLLGFGSPPPLTIRQGIVKSGETYYASLFPERSDDSATNLKNMTSFVVGRQL